MSNDLQTRLSVVSEENRFRIVEVLRAGPRSVGEIVTALGIAQPHVSRHLRILHEAGVVDVRRSAQRRIYSLQARPFREIAEWLESFSSIWAERMDALDSYLSEMDSNDHKEGDGDR